MENKGVTFVELCVVGNEEIFNQIVGVHLYRIYYTD